MNFYAADRGTNHRTDQAPDDPTAIAEIAETLNTARRDAAAAVLEAEVYALRALAWDGWEQAVLWEQSESLCDAMYDEQGAHLARVTAQRDRAVTVVEALTAADEDLAEVVDGNVEHDDEACPCDDTCSCANVARIEAVFRALRNYRAALAAATEGAPAAEPGQEEPVMTEIPRCGDAVLHHPTGEEWLVAYADAAQNVLSWCGWPPGTAQLSDCSLTRRCTDEEHRKLVSQILSTGRGDHRTETVRRLYGEAGHGAEGA